MYFPMTKQCSYLRLVDAIILWFDDVIISDWTMQLHDMWLDYFYDWFIIGQLCCLWLNDMIVLQLNATLVLFRQLIVYNLILCLFMIGQCVIVYDWTMQRFTCRMMSQSRTIQTRAKTKIRAKTRIKRTRRTRKIRKVSYKLLVNDPIFVRF